MGETESDLYSDIYKVILANYSELNDFILYNYPDVSRWGYSQQGVDVEVMPNRYKWHGISGSYALAIKQIREDLLRKSVYYRGSFKSFQAEFDPLLSLYKEILSDKARGLNAPILEIIKKFLISLDSQFNTKNYFINRLAEFYLLRSLIFYDLDNKPIKGLAIDISGKDLPPQGSHIFKTDKKGLVTCDLKSGTYVVKIERFSEEKTVDIKNFVCSFNFVLNVRKTGFFRRYKSIASL